MVRIKTMSPDEELIETEIRQGKHSNILSPPGPTDESVKQKGMGNPTTFGLIHGAWHQPVHFDPLIKSLKDHGYKAVAPALPSVDIPSDGPVKDSQADIAAVREVANKELASGADDILVPHSYGGIVATGVVKGLDPRSRADAGFDTSIVGIAAITAYVVAEGGSIPETAVQNKSQVPEIWDPPMPPSAFYGDLSAEESAKWVALLKPRTTAALFDASSFSAHEVVPVHFPNVGSASGSDTESE